MPRLYKRKTNKGLIPVEVMKNAVDAVKLEELSVELPLHSAFLVQL